MQALIELLAGFIALLAAAALGQFGVDLSAPSSSDREVHRVQDCKPDSRAALTPVAVSRDC